MSARSTCNAACSKTADIHGADCEALWDLQTGKNPPGIKVVMDHTFVLDEVRELENGTLAPFCIKCEYALGSVVHGPHKDLIEEGIRIGQAMDAALNEKYRRGIAMILSCPMCQHRHVDKGVFATKLHHTHACQFCGHCWRPALVDTVGVQFLPGFKDPE